MNLIKIRNNIHNALTEQDTAQAELIDAQAAYDKLLLEFEQQHQPIVQRRNAASKRYDAAKKSLAESRDAAKEVLSDNWLDDLPEGFAQNRKKVVKYDAQGFLAIAVERFPFLVTLDTNAVDTFFTRMAEEQKDGTIILPENIRRWASVEVVYEPQAQISNKTIAALEIQSPADEKVNDWIDDIEEEAIKASVEGHLIDEKIARDDAAADANIEFILEQADNQLPDNVPVPLSDINF